MKFQNMTLIDVDRELFLWINKDWSSQSLDTFFVTITDLHKQPLFIALAVVVLGLFTYRYKVKKVAIFVVQLLLLVGLTDAISYYGIKQLTYRHRPNNHPEVSSVLKLGYGPQSSSMPSNHATNSFAIATFVASKNIYAGAAMLVLASAVAVSRVYLGVHFPSDVVAGALLGVLLAIIYIKLIFKINKYKVNK